MKVANMIYVNGKKINLKAGVYRGSQLVKHTSISDGERLYLDLKGDVDVPVLEDDLIQIQGEEVFSVGNSNIPECPNLVNSHSININGSEIIEMSKSKLCGSSLKQLLHDDISNKVLYLELEGAPDYLLSDDDCLIISKSSKFLLVNQSNSDADIPDLEDCACGNHQPDKHQKYKIKIDKTKYKVECPRLTGREILALAGYDESRYLYQKFAGGERRQIELNEKVDFTEPGIERFHTMRCEHQEGLQQSRKHFSLPEEDVEFLNSLNLDWECVTENGIKRVVIRSFPLPDGYNLSCVDVNMQISNSYPTTQIDMAYFYPAISRADNKPIRALAQDVFDGKSWQRWSRHRTASNPWQPGVDNVATHVAYIQSWFTQELLK
ncbi:multiubiquitin domain-containing protein [Shewanella sp. Isolate13]|uniref:multiubiquitin domain-containing protein n=1 Tax=Shewanella sp. Isolate13 TaxID=2908531 RepID=UPI001EFD6707|nr:multiubiquitin domain-containing protein [Shewanella sp. Isolate13]MCG9729592.1 multiubiquitin domain-containing protein [Shewanella sp. Isolate13]